MDDDRSADETLVSGMCRTVLGVQRRILPFIVVHPNRRYLLGKKLGYRVRLPLWIVRYAFTESSLGACGANAQIQWPSRGRRRPLSGDRQRRPILGLPVPGPGDQPAAGDGARAGVGGFPLRR